MSDIYTFDDTSSISSTFGEIFLSDIIYTFDDTSSISSTFGEIFLSDIIYTFDDTPVFNIVYFRCELDRNDLRQRVEEVRGSGGGTSDC